MIIRAASSDSESEDDAVFPTHNGEARRSLVSNTSSVFAGPPAMQSDRAATPQSVQLAWLTATILLVALLLVDIASAVGQLSASDANAAQPQSVDAFSFGMLAALLLRPAREEASGGLGWALATTLNNACSLLFVSVWIHTRESHLHRSHRTSSSGRAMAPAWLMRAMPWGAIVAVLALGHAVSCLYILLALFESHGNRNKFWLGSARRSGNPIAPHA